MNVLSLFDGMSCGRVALERAGVPIENYVASEIDKHAIQIAKKNYPDTEHVGDVTSLYGFELPKIDLLLGGSPCQGFSFAGKQLAFDDPRSKLFFEYIRLLEECKPKYFLLENVRMKKEYQDIITKYLGVEPIAINSNLVSAQNRYRLYWTNIAKIEQPEDKGVFLENILIKPETNVELTHNYSAISKNQIRKNKRLPNEKSLSVGTIQAPTHIGTTLVPVVKSHRASGCIEVGHANLNGHDFLKRVYSPKGKSPTLTAVCGGNQERKIAVDAKHWRKLTPIECERLQTLPDNYTEGVSNSQRYKMIGNGWTVEAIVHILAHMPEADNYLLT